ncbi:hypothetical protein [Nonomuraea typhae]|uniref:hypothetical protein n=1 Tax=Nonomuraea typhae TaxID=2603600 RepID=UPI0012F98A2D|nr:hypothetical protein [Nonomuraea typhae]
MSERRAKRQKGVRHLWYGLGLVAGVAALVAVQVLPKLEDYALRTGGAAIAPAAGSGAAFSGSTWRLIGIGATPGEDLPQGTTGVTAIIGVTPGDDAAAKAMAKGCETAVRDARQRVWTTSSRVKGVAGVSTLCTQIDRKTYKPILAKPGVEVRFQASFAVPADAVSSLRVEVRLPDHYESFVRLTPPGPPSAEPPRAG